MRSYNAERRFHKAIKAILAYNRFLVFGREGTQKRLEREAMEQLREIELKAAEETKVENCDPKKLKPASISMFTRKTSEKSETRNSTTCKRCNSSCDHSPIISFSKEIH
jgi:hypothetical protein